MSEHKDLLIELGTEELPPKALKSLSQAFTEGIIKGLNEAELAFAEVNSYATPRRMAVIITDLASTQADKSVQRRGPAIQAAFDEDGCPSKAAIGFAKSCGVAVEALQKQETDKGAWLTFTHIEKGRDSRELIPEIFRNVLDKLPIPKRMHWSDLDAMFVRPVHWAIILHGSEVIPAEILSVAASNQTRGHRFHHPQSINIDSPQDYESSLHTQGRVIADFSKRRQLIKQQVTQAAKQKGASAVIDPDLLDEVTSMVEWPTVIVGGFDEHFLDVPAEALISAMKNHQKYFHMVNDQGHLLPFFITISNIESTDPEQIKKGNERVIRPRLADANFFWTQDKKQPLETHLQQLKSVVFQNKLGTVYDKTQRVAKLAAEIAAQLGADSADAERAALLAKCDLMTEMVNEFPDLQGIMGRYYALHDKEKELVALALDEQYMPRFAGDKTPATAIGQALSIAERLDTLMGIFAIGQIPSGDKDPFALRRAALGCQRTIIENQLELDVPSLLKQAARQLPQELNAQQAVDSVYLFMMDRLKSYFSDQSIAVDVFEAVNALLPAKPYDFARRVEAVNRFKVLDAAESLAAANKRISNILKKTNTRLADSIDHSLLREDAEKQLAAALATVTDRVKPLLADAQYTEALTMLAELREVVDQFFDDVMVMTDDEALKHNRLALLNNLRNLFMQVADLSVLQ